jgi:A/G-specific adenine glycosylase
MGFIEEVIKWYHVHKRDLPWRNTTDPYIIWLSEIILQQTRVEQGMPYFQRFTEKYPGVADFAAASEDEILNMWQGLGYYSRGRNMHRTAQMVMEEHAGYFPKKYDELIKLKGIGEYTAAAISSFAANEVKAVVDGNVFRVLARFFGIEEPINSSKAKKLFTEIANDVIDRDDPSTSNQALMEFGALQCRPKNPLCGNCPLRISCQAFKLSVVDKLPRKLKKAPSRNRYFNYLVVLSEGRILMQKRGGNDIWENLYQFPLFESEHPQDALQVLTSDKFKEMFGEAVVLSVFGPVKHVLSHQNINAQFISIDILNPNIDLIKNNFFFAELKDLEQLAQPQLIFSFVKKFLI